MSLAGVEPWTFYFVNGFLNFNVVFVLALLAVLLVELQVGEGGRESSVVIDCHCYLRFSLRLL